MSVDYYADVFTRRPTIEEDIYNIFSENLFEIKKGYNNAKWYLITPKFKSFSFALEKIEKRVMLFTLFGSAEVYEFLRNILRDEKIKNAFLRFFTAVDMEIFLGYSEDYKEILRRTKYGKLREEYLKSGNENILSQILWEYLETLKETYFIIVKKKYIDIIMEWGKKRKGIYTKEWWKRGEELGIYFEDIFVPFDGYYIHGGYVDIALS